MNQHQEYEADWWGTCVNTFSEEAKQITYAYNMGLLNVPDSYTGRWPQYDLGGKSVLDIGGGPTSILLKCVNFSRAVVVDPCPYPVWVRDRYTFHGVESVETGGETFRTAERFDEAWIYNVLQHVENPLACLETAREHAKVLRIFEWIDTPPSLGHPHTITKRLLDEFLGVTGSAAPFDGSSNGVYGRAYFGEYLL